MPAFVSLLRTVLQMARAELFLLLLSAMVGVGCGVSCAIFLLGLSWCTHVHQLHPWLIWALAPAGFGLGSLWTWLRFPSSGMLLVHAGLEGREIPIRLLPAVLLGTWWSHLFGASVGREGAAVQVGAVLAQGVSHLFRFRAPRVLIFAGFAGGFAGVFGTPLAAIVFAFEFQRNWSNVMVRAALPSVVSAFIAHQTARRLGVEHTQFPSILVPSMSADLWFLLAAFALASGVLAALYVHLMLLVRSVMSRWFMNLSTRLAAAGLFLAVLSLIPNSTPALGLGLPLLEAAFQGRVSFNATAFKLLFTALSVGAGFVGGEVTSLFVIGATFGSACASPLHLPAPLLAMLGLVCVFSSAGKVPLAMAVLAAELFGSEFFPLALMACAISTVINRKPSLYSGLA
jgi:H+/Cl- antiporter ClcA